MSELVKKLLSALSTSVNYLRDCLPGIATRSAVYLDRSATGSITVSLHVRPDQVCLVDVKEGALQICFEPPLQNSSEL